MNEFAHVPGVREVHHKRIGMPTVVGHHCCYTTGHEDYSGGRNHGSIDQCTRICSAMVSRSLTEALRRNRPTTASDPRSTIADRRRFETTELTFRETLSSVQNRECARLVCSPGPLSIHHPLIASRLERQDEKVINCTLLVHKILYLTVFDAESE